MKLADFFTLKFILPPSATDAGAPLTGKRALSLSFSRLASQNGFKRTAAISAIFFDYRGKTAGVNKIAVKQSFDLSSSSELDEIPPMASLTIGDAVLSSSQSHGTVQSKSNTISWNLKMEYPEKNLGKFWPYPKLLTQMGLVRNQACTISQRLHLFGEVTINGEKWNLDQTTGPGIGSLGFRSGQYLERSWVWAQCNQFVNEQGAPSDFVFEGQCSKVRMGPVVSPEISSFMFYYKGRSYCFNRLNGMFQIKSKHTLTEWDFVAGQEDLSFRGTIRAEHKDFAGITFEDTDGSFLNCSSSMLSDMKIHIYRTGKLESTLDSQKTTSFELASKEKNPYVPILI